MCYPVCGMMHIKEPLLLIEKSSPCNGSGLNKTFSSLLATRKEVSCVNFCLSLLYGTCYTLCLFLSGTGELVAFLTGTGKLVTPAVCKDLHLLHTNSAYS